MAVQDYGSGLYLRSRRNLTCRQAVWCSWLRMNRVRGIPVRRNAPAERAEGAFRSYQKLPWLEAASQGDGHNDVWTEVVSIGSTEPMIWRLSGGRWLKARSQTMSKGRHTES